MGTRDSLEITVVIGALLPLLGACGFDVETIGAVVGIGAVCCWAPIVADAIGVRT